MAQKKKPTQSEIDGVQYRRVPTWCIAIAEMQGGAAMAFYSLVGLMSYVASEGYPSGSTSCTPASANCAS